MPYYQEIMKGLKIIRKTAAVTASFAGLLALLLWAFILIRPGSAEVQNVFSLPVNSLPIFSGLMILFVWAVTPDVKQTLKDLGRWILEILTELW